MELVCGLGLWCLCIYFMRLKYREEENEKLRKMIILYWRVCYNEIFIVAESLTNSLDAIAGIN